MRMPVFVQLHLQCCWTHPAPWILQPGLRSVLWATSPTRCRERKLCHWGFWGLDFTPSCNNVQQNIKKIPHHYLAPLHEIWWWLQHKQAFRLDSVIFSTQLTCIPGVTRHSTYMEMQISVIPAIFTLKSSAITTETTALMINHVGCSSYFRVHYKGIVICYPGSQHDCSSHNTTRAERWNCMGYAAATASLFTSVVAPRLTPLLWSHLGQLLMFPLHLL